MNMVLVGLEPFSVGVYADYLAAIAEVGSALC